MMEMVDMQDLGSCAVRRVGSNPTTRTTSSRTAYRSRRLFFKKSSLAQSVAPPLQTEPAALGFGLVLAANLKAAASGIYSVPVLHVVADCISFATTFFKSHLSLIHSVAPPPQMRPAALGSHW